MKEREVTEWTNRPSVRRVLVAFSSPATPRQAERALGIKKLKMRPFLSKGLLECLNPDGRKGRFYMLTDRAREMLKLPNPENEERKDWGLIGWIKGASPHQRLVLLMTVNSVKRTSEEIRERASRFNPHLTRISTKGILKELIAKGLVETEMNGIYRNYWLSDKGKGIARDIAQSSGQLASSP